MCLSDKAHYSSIKTTCLSKCIRNTRTLPVLVGVERSLRVVKPVVLTRGTEKEAVSSFFSTGDDQACASTRSGMKQVDPEGSCGPSGRPPGSRKIPGCFIRATCRSGS